MKKMSALSTTAKNRQDLVLLCEMQETLIDRLNLSNFPNHSAETRTKINSLWEQVRTAHNSIWPIFRQEPLTDAEIKTVVSDEFLAHKNKLINGFLSEQGVLVYRTKDEVAAEISAVSRRLKSLYNKDKLTGDERREINQLDARLMRLAQEPVLTSERDLDLAHVYHFCNN